MDEPLGQVRAANLAQGAEVIDGLPALVSALERAFALLGLDRRGRETHPARMGASIVSFDGVRGMPRRSCNSPRLLERAPCLRASR